MKLKIHKQMVVLTAILCMGLEYLYLLDTDLSLFGVGLDDVALLAAIAWGGYTWLVLSKYPTPKFQFGIPILSCLLLTVTGTLQSYWLNGQPLILGIRVQRTFFVWAMLYFPVRKALACRVITIRHIKQMLRFIAIAELILLASQYILADHIMFLHARTGKRYNQLRIYMQPIVLNFLLLSELDNFLTYKARRRIRSAFWVAVCLLEIMIILKFRLNALGMLGTICIGVVFCQQRWNSKIQYILIGIIACTVLLGTELFQDVLDIISGRITSSSLLIRAAGRKLYFQVFSKHPLLGGGVPNELHTASAIACGITKNIYLVDNGLIAFMYMYGSLGIAWFVMLWGKLLRNGWKLLKNHKRLLYLLFPIFFLITGLNELHWYWDSGMTVLVMFIAMSEQELVNAQKRKALASKEA